MRQARAAVASAYESWRLRGFRNRHAGERCFLIGNGPSLRRQDLSVLRGETVFVTNLFVLHEQHDVIAPSYYCVSDVEFFRKLTPDVAEVVRKKAARMTNFVPYDAKPIIERAGLFARRSAYYIREAANGAIWEVGDMVLDPSVCADDGETVIIDHCLSLAHYMGFSDVVLLGCDTDYGLEQAGDYSGAYFYDVNAYPPTRDATHHTTVWYERVIRSYEVARRLFERDGRRICNATEGGKLEVFPRVALGDVVSGRRLLR